MWTVDEDALLACVTGFMDDAANLESEEQHESHHKTEETHGLGQSESQDCVWEELLLQTGVAGIADDQAAKDSSNTSTFKANEALFQLEI